MPDITMQQIENFLAVSKHLSFSEAAKEMYISQPALSQIISRLENVIGASLFVRKTNGVELTKEGEYLYYEFRLISQNLSKALKNVTSISEPPTKKLRFAFHTTYDFISKDNGAFKSALKAYKNKYPDVTVSEQLFEFKELRSALIQEEVDIIYSAAFAYEDLKGVSHKKLGNINLYVQMSSNHPLATSEDLDFSKLSHEIFYFVSPSYTNDTEYYLCAQMGFTPKSIQHLSNFPSVISAVRQGKGLTISGDLLTTLGGNEIKYFLCPEIPDQPRIGVAWLTNHVSQETFDFIEMLEEI